MNSLENSNFLLSMILSRPRYFAHFTEYEISLPSIQTFRYVRHLCLVVTYSRRSLRSEKQERCVWRPRRSKVRATRPFV